MRRCGRWAAASLVASAVAVLAGACAPGDTRPSALLITLDTTRVDALSSYGAPEGVTPNLDALAEESVRYTRAYTTAPITLPSHASMLTGLYPPRHTVRDNGIAPLPSSARTLSELAASEGIETAAFVAAVVLDRRFGLDQGFEHWSQPGHVSLRLWSHATERPARAVVADAVRWLRGRSSDRPFFLWVHLFDPHGPYEPPERFRGRFEASSPARGYLGEVASADAEIGRLVATLQELGELDRTTIVVVADHGEAFGEHEEISHGTYVWETTMRVPLLVRHADGHRAGEVSSEVVSVVDAFPTLLGALALDVPPDVDGLDLRAPVDPARGVYFESYMGFLAFSWNPLSGWVDRDAKLVHAGRARLFDPVADPGEARDLSEQRPGDVERLERALRTVAAASALAPDVDEDLDAELAAGIEALGYVSVPGARDELPVPGDATGLPDPLERRQQAADAIAAMELNNAGRFDEAERILRGLIEGNPRNFFALDRLSIALIERERWAEAAEVLEQLVREGPAWSHSSFNLGLALLEVDRETDALDAFRRACELDPARRVDLAEKLRRLRDEGENATADRIAEALAHELPGEPVGAR